MIDWQRVNDLRDEVGAEDFVDVIEMFLEEADEGIERLSVGPDPATLEAEFHALKGSALNLGFQSFAEICATEEKRAASGEQEAIDVAVAVASYRASRADFEAHFDNSIAA